MPAKKPLTAQRARELFDYDPESGILRRKIAFGKARVGEPAGHRDASGYLKVSADCYPYFVHRIIWLIVVGEWPEQIDHADLNRSNNKWANLREANLSQNMANRTHHADCRSGKKGVSFHPQTKKWRAQIYHAGKRYSLGLYHNIDDAAKAYMAAAQKHFGKFARI